MQLLQKFISIFFREISFIILSGWGDPYYKCLLWGFPCGPVAKTMSSPCRGTGGSIPGQGTRSWMQQLRDPTGHNEDRRSCMLQLRLSAAKKKKKKSNRNSHILLKKKKINAFCDWMEASRVVDHADFSWQEVIWAKSCLWRTLTH